MPNDYGIAAVRHYRDAESLAAARRFDNAGYLVGLAAECALKHGARGFTTPPNVEISGHLPQVKGMIRAILRGRNASGPLLSFVSNRQHFDNWDINNRYENDGHVNQPTYDAWKKLTQTAFGIVRLRA